MKPEIQTFKCANIPSIDDQDGEYTVSWTPHTAGVCIDDPIGVTHTVFETHINLAYDNEFGVECTYCRDLPFVVVDAARAMLRRVSK